jgi:2-oxoglutarate ferredoxin oxidoreductase subunit delta
MAKVSIDSEICKGCGLCADACPKKILCIDAQQINRKGHSPAAVTDEELCIGCGFCAMMCPDCAITVER